jgi:hypothetical protein
MRASFCRYCCGESVARICVPRTSMASCPLESLRIVTAALPNGSVLGQSRASDTVYDSLAQGPAAPLFCRPEKRTAGSVFRTLNFGTISAAVGKYSGEHQALTAPGDCQRTIWANEAAGHYATTLAPAMEHGAMLCKTDRAAVMARASCSALSLLCLRPGCATW